MIFIGALQFGHTAGTKEGAFLLPEELELLLRFTGAGEGALPTEAPQLKQNLAPSGNLLPQLIQNIRHPVDI
ncbi:MAG: hypothetical protein MJ084_04280 [Saccharofermentans sp.]|nr:hypothetical protein [Saccharofermentans sp.]